MGKGGRRRVTSGSGKENIFLYTWHDAVVLPDMACCGVVLPGCCWAPSGRAHLPNDKDLWFEAGAYKLLLAAFGPFSSFLSYDMDMRLVSLITTSLRRW